MTDTRAAGSERRSVAVLFSDLKGFSAYAEGHDPEEVQELVSALFARFRAAIEEEGGYVDKFIGDAVMAVFGAPAAHEDDALRAVRAGLRLQEAARAFGEERGWAPGVRVGINAGEVVWGEVAGDRATAIGDAVNVAQRLESVCAPGRVLVSEEIERATRGRVAYRRLDPVALRGRSAPVQVFEAEGLELRRPLSMAPAGTEAPFAGREAELARLEEQFRGCVAERVPAFVLLEGEAGIGKTRLLRELRARLEAAPAGCRFGHGVCAREEPGSCAPFLQAFLRRAGASPHDADAGARVASLVAADLAAGSALDPLRRENFAHLVALSTGLDVPDAPVKQMPPEARPRETALAWESWLRAWAGNGALFVVEDAHWADPATRRLLDALSARAADLPLLLVATQRLAADAADRPHGSTGAVGLDLPRFRRFPLGPLAPDDLARACAAPPALAALLHERSGGNPWFALELARALRERGLEAADAPPVLPATLNGLLVSRLDDLTPSARRAAKVASVVGRVFWQELLEGILGAPATEDLRTLSRLGHVAPAEAEGAISGEHEFRFKHAFLHEAAYGLLTKRERRDLHEEIARALEARVLLGKWAASPAEGWALCARHWERAGEGREHEAEARWLRAGEAALAGERPEAALEMLGRAGNSFQALQNRAEARRRLGPLSAALEEGRRAAAAARGPAETSSAHVALASTLASSGALAEALREADTAVASAPDDAGRLAALHVRCTALGHLGRLDECAAAARERLDIAVRTGDRSAEAGAHIVLGNIAHRRGNLDESLQMEERARDLARAAGQRGLLAAALVNIGNVQRFRGRLEEALAAAREAADIRRSIGDRANLGRCLINVGACLRQLKRPEEAMAAYTEGLEASRDLGETLATAGVLGAMANLYGDLGRKTEALAASEEALDLRRKAGDPEQLVYSLVQHGEGLFDAGRPAEARRLVEEGVELARRFNLLLGGGHGLAILARIDSCEGRPEPARRLLLEAREFFAKSGSARDVLGVEEDLAVLDLPFRPENDLERTICADPEWRAGAAWGVPRPGHAEGTVLAHIVDVLANVERAGASHEDRARLRLVAILHDAFKHRVDPARPHSGENHHGMLARRFAERKVQDPAVLDLIELHDEAYNAWRSATWKGDWPRAEQRVERLAARLRESLPLYVAFYRADNRTASKDQAPLDWFEDWLRRTGRLFSDARLPE